MEFEYTSSDDTRCALCCTPMPGLRIDQDLFLLCPKCWEPDPVEEA